MSDARRAFAATSACRVSRDGLRLRPLARRAGHRRLARRPRHRAGRSPAGSLRSTSTLRVSAAAVGLLMSGLVVGLVGVAVSGPVCRALGSEGPGLHRHRRDRRAAARLRGRAALRPYSSRLGGGGGVDRLLRPLPLLRHREARTDPAPPGPARAAGASWWTTCCGGLAAAVVAGRRSAGSRRGRDGSEPRAGGGHGRTGRAAGPPHDLADRRPGALLLPRPDRGGPRARRSRRRRRTRCRSRFSAWARTSSSPTRDFPGYVAAPGGRLPRGRDRGRAR